LSLSFPYPILADDIRITLDRSCPHVDLVLKKALWEPWPCEYRRADDLHNILDPDQLKSWKEEESLQPSLEYHIRSQFNINHLENTSLMGKYPLNVVRCVMQFLFFESLSSSLCRHQTDECTSTRLVVSSPSSCFNNSDGQTIPFAFGFRFPIGRKTCCRRQMEPEKDCREFEASFPWRRGSIQHSDPND
jgi:hypothetical protein